MEETLRTKQGHIMNRRLRSRIITYMAGHEGVTVAFAAKALGIHRRTLQDYLTEEVRAAIRAATMAGVAEPSIEDVDRAMLRAAAQGNVAAARLVYLRLNSTAEPAELPSLEDMEAEILRLRALQNQRKAFEHGEDLDAAAAVGDDAS